MIRSKKFWGVLASLFFLWLALRRVDWERLPPILKTVDFRFAVAVLVSLTTELLWRGLRWQILLQDRSIPFSDAYCGLMLCFLFNNILPARAGEFVRAVYLGRKGRISASEAFGSVVLERFADGLAVVSLLLAALLLHPVSPVIRQAGYSAMVFYFVILIAILFLQFRPDWAAWATGLVLRVLPARFREAILSAQESFIRGLAPIRSPRRFLVVIGLTFLAWGNSVLTYFLSLKMFHLPFGLDVAILLIAVLSLGAMIPSSPGMIGIFEYCCMLVLADMMGTSRELAASFGLLSHFLSFAYVLVVGMSILTRENLSLQDLQEKEPPPVS